MTPNAISVQIISPTPGVTRKLPLSFAANVDRGQHQPDRKKAIRPKMKA